MLFVIGGATNNKRHLAGLDPSASGAGGGVGGADGGALGRKA